jgi:hypothetical protein
MRSWLSLLRTQQLWIGLKMSDLVKVGGTYALIPISFAIAGLWWWFWFFMSVGVCLCVGEALSYRITGHSLSEEFWEMKSRKMKIIIITAWLGFALYLAAHLLWRM